MKFIISYNLYSYIVISTIAFCLFLILDLTQNKKHSFIATSKLLIVLVVALLFASLRLFIQIRHVWMAQRVPYEELRPLFLYITMLVGMFCKYLWDYTAPKTRRKFNYKLFLRPVIISPIVFSVVWVAMGNKTSFITFFFSFQNGFFWQTILERKM